MNRKEYNSDPRYAKILEQMDLLGIMDVTTTRQNKNGTIIWKLPIKMYGKLIKVGSFKSGYVRRMDVSCRYGGTSAYQLNKCEPCVTYYKDYNSKWVDGEYIQKFTGKYNKYVGKSRILIDNEVDRLEYLISYCLKNYYINQANIIENGKFIPKWKHEYEMENMRGRYEELSLRFEETAMELDELTVTVNGHKYKIV